MLRTSNAGPPAKPDIQRAVDKLLKDDTNFDRNENRSAHRENLVRAVDIEIRDPQATISAFSRNISATGIGVITKESLVGNPVAVLTIAGLGEKDDVTILAECRWCRAYGKEWFISGWQFINLKR